MNLKKNIKNKLKRLQKPFLKKVTDSELKNKQIIIYFFGFMGQTYQIKQWINTFKELDKKHPLVIVVRNENVEIFFKKTLPFDIIYSKTLNNLHDMYNFIDPKVIIYINNGYKNFQSLIHNDAMHIHINHGESDKSSDHSNQIKGYDYVFVHAPNGFNNYMKYLIKINPNKFIQTGRPQLDFIQPVKLNTYGKKVIIYAPTWEATHRSMRYTSVDVYGEKIVNSIIDSDYFLIYKPHPNLGAHDKNVLKIHKKLLKQIKFHKYATTITNNDINNIYPLVDFAIFDMSSVMTDYLLVNKPFVLADVFDPLVHKVQEYNVLNACRRINSNNIDNLLEIIKDNIENDSLKEKREEIKKLYLGDFKKGESIKKFIDSISNIIKQRDIEISQKYQEVLI